jgi:YVTN family beta-propeller protein
MKPRGFSLTACVGVLALGALGFGAHTWTVAHVQRWTGRQDLGFVGCNHCHLVRLERMPWAQERPRHAAPAGLAVSPDGQRVFIALDELDQVVEADTASNRVLRKVTIGGGPFGLTLDSTGEQLFVACRHADRIAVLDTRELKESANLEVGLAPVAVAFCETKVGPRLLVANSGSDDISVLSVAPLREIARPAAGREPFAVATTADGARAFVANRLATVTRQTDLPAAELTVLDPASGRIVSRQRLDSAHLSEGVGTVPTREWTLTPLVKVRNLVPITQVANGWVMSSGLAISDAGGSVLQIPLDEANDYFADPSGIAVDRSGRRAYVASSGGDAVSVIDLEKLARWIEHADEATRHEAIDDLALAPQYVAGRIPTGRNPRHLTLSPDGRTLFVAERLEDAVLVIDTTTLRPAGKIVLGDGALDDPRRRGERVFTRASNTFQRQFSCRSCHPDGHVDGLSYDFDGDGLGDNLLDNRTLLAVANTGPFKWNGKNPSLDVQCGPRFARVLMRTEPFPPHDLRDLVTFIQSLPPPRTRKQGTPLTPAQERGRQIFFATRTPDGNEIPRRNQCHTCHRPPLYTTRLPAAVGSRGPRDTTDQFDTPHLLGIATSAPYLHDGRAATLEELWTVFNTNDVHGVSSYMDKKQLNDLVEFLKTL